ncbi:hypothetical protein [Soonwooa sp.]|uniref:hypothetical protein n=1 Tax=Soonwooa sp. TaxID=1938592 RepID=UPI0028AC3E4B|nr:hypothetical protein [Soonwooa sp.]
MKHCNISTINHEKVRLFPSIVEDIHDVFLRDGCELKNASPFYDKQIMVINGDELENNFCFLDSRNLSSKKKSVDIIFIAKELDKKEMFFTELKLNSKENFYKLNKFSFRDKANNSFRAMGTSVPLSKKYFIVFSSKVINEARRFLYRQNPKLNNDFVAITTMEFYAKFFNNYG